jgi:hypothetical protein
MEFKTTSFSPRYISTHGNVKLDVMALGLIKSGSAWAKAGFPATPENELKNRLEICRSCPEWDSFGFLGSGKCKMCGCSTKTKLRMATAKCPLDKW